MSKTNSDDNNQSNDNKSGNTKTIMDYVKGITDRTSTIFNSNRLATYISVAAVIIYILIFVFFRYYIALDHTESASVMSITVFSSSILIALILMGALSIFIYASNNFVNSVSPTTSKFGIISFIKSFIAYIPCLFIDFVNFIVKEYKFTTSPILILFIAELCFILGYIYLQEILTIINPTERIYILENSSFLNKEVIKSLPDDIYLDGIFRKNYAISMWIYLNNSVNNGGKEMNIYKFADGIPRITYYPNKQVGDTTEQVLRIYFNNNTADSNPYYDLIIPFQKWIYMVFNYSSSQADLFVNGNLERTFHFNHMTPTIPQSVFRNSTIGADNGLSGAISNIQYHTEHLSKYEIVNSYNLL